MYVAENNACPYCHGTRTIRLQEREFAICGVCGGRGYVQKYQKLTAAQILGMLWRQDPANETRYAVNSGDGGPGGGDSEQSKGSIKKA